MRPLRNRVIIKQEEEAEQTPGGIFIPTNAQEKPVRGVVIAVGNGKIKEDGSLRPVDLKVGEKVLFSKYSGSIIKIDNVDHLIMTDDEVLAVIDN